MFFAILINPRTKTRYAFCSEEKVALQEIGPRFTLKLKSLRKGLPAVQNFGEAPKKVEFQVVVNEAHQQLGEGDEARVRESIDGAEAGDGTRSIERDLEMLEGESQGECRADEGGKKIFNPPTQDEFLWLWKVCFVAVLFIYYPQSHCNLFSLDV